MSENNLPPRYSYRVPLSLLPDDQWITLFHHLLNQADRFRAVFGPEMTLEGRERVMRLGGGRDDFLALVEQGGAAAYIGSDVVMEGSIVVEGPLGDEARRLLVRWGLHLERPWEGMWMYSLLTETHPLLQVVDSTSLDVFLVDDDVQQLLALGVEVGSWRKHEDLVLSSWYTWEGFWEGHTRITELTGTDQSPFAFYATGGEGQVWPIPDGES
jgi:hypothetical protein